AGSVGREDLGAKVEQVARKVGDPVTVRDREQGSHAVVVLPRCSRTPQGRGRGGGGEYTESGAESDRALLSCRPCEAATSSRPRSVRASTPSSSRTCSTRSRSLRPRCW